MPESEHHKQLKRKDAGKTGETEVELPSGARLDALSPTRIAIQIERGDKDAIDKAVEVLKEALDTGVARKVRLRVNQPRIDNGFEAMRRKSVGGELTNLGGTYKTRVPKKRK